MNASHPHPGERARHVYFTEDALAVDLSDGHPRLLDATTEQRTHWKVTGAGFGIHWPDLDEDLSTEGLLRGAPAAAESAHTYR